MAKSNKISIFYVIADSSLVGGPRHLLSLVDNLPSRDFALSVILPQGPLADELKKKKIPIFMVPMRARSDVGAVQAINKLLRKYDPHILHAHGQRAGVLSRLAVPGLPIKTIYTEHTYTPQFHLANPILDWTHVRAMKILDMATDMNIAVSQAVANFLINSKVTRPNKVQVIYNGIEQFEPKHIDKSTLDIINQHGLRKQDIIIGTIGSLNIQKDTATLIKAMEKILKKLPKARLVLVGSGPLQKKLEQLAKKLKIDKQVVFTGSLANVAGILQLFTIFVLPSKSEAFGISILEAMRAGVPVIATKVGGIPEVVVNNKNGLLVDPGNPKQLSATIMKLLNDKKLQNKLIAGGRETVRDFSVNRMVQTTSKLYKELMGK
ncbi:glycosyltransferase family 4 protein [Patescibacteria group bacterium]|nr:glycosyltransferase family 4 protein [Patescibacteria group bacterium]